MRWFFFCVFVFLVLQPSGTEANEEVSKLLEPFQPNRLVIVAVYEGLNLGGGVNSGEADISPIREFGATGYQVALENSEDLAARFTVSCRKKDHVRRSRTTITYPRNQWLGQRFYEACRYSTGPLREGDYVPMFGWVYELAGINIPSEANEGADLILRKVPHDRWPQGITLDPYAYAITNGGYLTVPRALVGSADVKVSFDPEQQQFQLTTVIGYQGPSMLIERREQKAVAKVGELLNLGHVQLRIVSVVPPNAKQHIPGWVEFRYLWPKIVPYGFEQTSEVRRRGI